MIGVSRRRRYNTELVFIFSCCVFLEPEFRGDGIVLNVDDIIDVKREAFVGRVELLYRMRPCVSVCRYQVASVSDVAVIEVVICGFDDVFETNADSNPADKLFDLDAPLHNFS